MIDINYIFILYVFLICLGLNLIFFIIAFCLKSDAFTDLTYALTFILVLTIILIWKNNHSLIQILVYVLVVLWALRLGIYLFIRILKIKVDHRFDKMRDSFFKFLGFWVMQGISVFLIVLPASFALEISSKYFDEKNYYTLIFFIIALLALIYETVADAEKFTFFNNRTNQDQFINSGLWKLSRHPNYFGEISFWIFLACGFLFNLIIKNFENNHLILLHLLWLLSPLYILVLVTFISGLPILEINSYKKLKDNKQYQKYVDVTSAIIPFFGKKGNIWRVKKMIVKEQTNKKR